MRLFIAINFNDDIKEELENNIEDLKDEAKRGNFSLIDNLHLTLAFIGELDKRNLQKGKYFGTFFQPDFVKMFARQGLRYYNRL